MARRVPPIPAGRRLVIVTSADELRAAMKQGGEVLSVREAWRRGRDGRRHPHLVRADVSMPDGL